MKFSEYSLLNEEEIIIQTFSDRIYNILQYENTVIVLIGEKNIRPLEKILGV